MSNTPAPKGDENSELYDTIIVGGGPAGVAAGIYAGRGRLKTLVLDSMGGGGQLNVIDIIENYPGFVDPVSGPQLFEAMRLQMEKFGVEITFDGVEKVEAGEDFVTVVGDGGTYRGKTLIVASGAKHRDLCVPGESELQGRGVSYCATCDGAFFRGQRVAVVGGGDTAVKEALYLSRLVEHVTVVHRRDRLRAEKVMQEKALATPNMSFVWDTVVERVLGEEGVTGLALKNVKTGETSTLEVSGVFIFIGVIPNTSFLQGVVALDEARFAKTCIDMRTSHPRIFAVGDVRSGSVRQIASAVGDGTTAILAVQEMLDTATPPRDLPVRCEL